MALMLPWSRSGGLRAQKVQPVAVSHAVQVSGSSLGQQPTLLLGCDVEGDFSRLVYDLHFAFLGLSIWEKYRLAQELVAGVVDKGVMEIIRIAYVEDSPGRLRPVTVTSVTLDEFRRVWDHPVVWDPEKVYSAPELLGMSDESLERFAIEPTALGHRVLKDLFEAGSGRGQQAEPGAAPDPISSGEGG